MVCLFTFVNNGDLITGAAKMIFKVEFSTSFYSGRGQLLQADEVTTDSDILGLHVFRIDIGPSPDSRLHPRLMANTECCRGVWRSGGVEVLTFWIKNEEWEEAGVLTMGQSA